MLGDGSRVAPIIPHRQKDLRGLASNLTPRKGLLIFQPMATQWGDHPRRDDALERGSVTCPRHFNQRRRGRFRPNCG
jgi:hypothetical protein